MQTDNAARPQTPEKERIAKYIQAAVIASHGRAYDEALRQIDEALSLDPQHAYARSFKRRILSELEISKIKEGTASPERTIEKTSELLSRAEQFIQSKHYQLALQEVLKVREIDPQNFYAGSYLERINELIAQEGNAPHTPQPEPPQQTTAADIIEFEPTTGPHESHLMMYTELLKEFWFDGALKEEEIAELKKVREIFHISAEEHGQLERLVQIDAYVEALRIALSDGELSTNEEKVLEIMRQKYGISMQEHMSAEAKLLWAKTHAKTKGSILVVEDEASLLKPLALQLRKHGYDVLTAESVESALDILKQNTPAIILSDLMFPGGLTGLQFYELVRKTPQLRQVPFLLMSGIKDEFIVRAGMRMGVDNFIAKPFKLEDLLAVIEGKLRA
ncbi:MAG: response regulator [Ignavibacteriales bacterium]|nr:response regulator [Ignavibacteriales bacterium]